MLDRIETEEEYREALQQFLDISQAPKNADEVKKMYILMDMMEKYEREQCSQN